MDQNVEEWSTITHRLIDDHPIDSSELVDVVLDCWEDILGTKVAERLKIGIDVRFSPQMMSNFLDALIPVELGQRHPGVWRGPRAKFEKDLVYVPNDHYSTEIKCSSSRSDIYANRSYAQPSLPGTKPKDGYYVAVNFESFRVGAKPAIVAVRFGWLDHSDWIPQAAATGQQARLAPQAKAHKLIQLYAKS